MPPPKPCFDLSTTRVQSTTRGKTQQGVSFLSGLKKYLPVPFMVLCLLFTAALRYDGALEAEGLALNTVVLPIEVFGEDGHIEAVQVDVANPAGVDSMYLVGHALGYHNSPDLWNGVIERDDKASYRVNGGQWRPISNANANVRYPEREYLGIGGGYHTVRLSVPVTGVIAGANTIEFRFNGTEGVSSGYRILELDLLGAGGASHIGNTTFVQDDPEAWEAPTGYDSPADVAAGEQLWTERNSLINSPLPGSTTIVASCSDCHAYSGYDLKYFNYSNTSIIERSKFHGLSEEEGSQIAAYIRQVDLDRDDGRETSPYAQPWNPPYQPGVNLTDRGEDDWSAGAGLEAVLDSDDDLAHYLFPDQNGNVPNFAPSREDIRRAFHVGTWEGSDEHAWGNRVDIQNQPIALQLPDWNNWLPDIHPLDVYGFNAFTSTEPWQYHLEMYSRLDSSPELQGEIDQYRTFLVSTNNGASGLEEVFSRLMNGHDLSMLSDFDYTSDPSAHFLGRLSYHGWQSVKTWEVVNRYKLQDLGSELFEGLVVPDPWEGAGDRIRAIGSRGEVEVPYFWPMPNNTVFDLAPHKNAKPYWPHEGPYGQSELLSQFYSTAWYEVQLMLTRGLVGVQASNGGGPIDWAYQNALIGSLEDLSSVSNFWRRIRTRVIGIQTHNNYWMQRTTGHGGMDCQCGQIPKPSNFYEVWGHGLNASGSNWNGSWVLNEPLARAAAEELLSELFEFRASIPYDLLPVDDSDHSYYEDQNYVPEPYSGSGQHLDSYQWADNLYRLLPILDTWGTRTSLVDSLAQWGEMMWPRGDWEQWFSEGGGGGGGGTPPSVTLTQPQNGQVFIAPANIFLEAGVLEGTVPIDRVEFYSGDTLIGTDAAPPFQADWTGIQPGTYVLSAKAIDQAGEEGESSPVAITVVEETGTNLHHIPLLPGWNLVSTYMEPDDPSLESMFSDIAASIVMVRSADDRMFVPNSEVNDITTWQKGEAYQIYAEEPVTLVVEGTPADPSSSPIELLEGVYANGNMREVAYLRDSPMPVSEALQSLGDDLVVVKDGFGRIYLPDIGIDQIEELLPGQGYKIVVAQNATLTYPQNGSNAGPRIPAKLVNDRKSNSAQRRTVSTRFLSRLITGSPLVSAASKTGFRFGGYTPGNTATLVLETPGELEGYLIGVRNTESDVVGEAVVEENMAVLSVSGLDVVDPPEVIGAESDEILELFILGVDGREIDGYQFGTVLDVLSGSEEAVPVTYQRDALWLADLELKAVSEEQPEVAEIEVSNFPNPFNSVTTIAYSISEAVDVEVQVMDILGRIVATLVSGERESGAHRVDFDASALASGLYFYRVRAGQSLHTGRMVVAR